MSIISYVAQPSPLVITGSIAIDRIMGFDGRYQDLITPENIKSLSISPLLNRLEISNGGVAANVCYSLALLGDAPVLLGSVGADASAYMDSLKRLGVNISHVHTSDVPTASFSVITDRDENQVGGFFPGAMSDSRPQSFRPWKGTNAIVVVGPHDPAGMVRQVLEARDFGLRLIYDVSQQVTSLSGEELMNGLQAAEILILNEFEMSMLAEKTGLKRSEMRNMVPIIITTLGKDGSLIEGSKVPKAIRVPIAQPRQVLDPTGAGDAYRSGLLYGLARGWDLATSARLGATVASFAIEHHGTQGHSFTTAEVAERYRTNFDQELPPLTEKSHAHH
jgi:adenosine kinase